MVALGEDPLTAVAAPRLHHQLYPPFVSAENWTSGSMPFHIPAPLVQVGLPPTPPWSPVENFSRVRDGRFLPGCAPSPCGKAWLFSTPLLPLWGPIHSLPSP